MILQKKKSLKILYSSKDAQSAVYITTFQLKKDTHAQQQKQKEVYFALSLTLLSLLCSTLIHKLAYICTLLHKQYLQLIFHIFDREE
jgi:hypothetical protein